MNKKQKREAGRIKAEEDLAQSIASGLKAQKADQVRQEESQRRIEALARRKDAEYKARLETEALKKLIRAKQ